MRLARACNWLGLLALLAAASLGLRGDATPAARYQTLGHKLICMCGCQQTVLACNTPHCSWRGQMKAELKSDIGKGLSDSLVEQEFIQQWGTLVLAVPHQHGFGLLAWVMPWLAALAGLSLLVWYLRRGARQAPAPAPLSEAELERVRREVAEQEKDR